MNQKTDDVIIKTHLGLVSGAKKKGGFLFKGIPYGADTSGENRWKAPQEPIPWDGVFEAKEFGPQCPQFRICLLYTSPSPRDAHESRMPSSA